MKTVKGFDEAVRRELVTAPMRATKRPVTVRCARVLEAFTVETMEGNMTAEAGSILIQGVKGEIYPCNEEIFDATYTKEEPCASTESD